MHLILGPEEFLAERVRDEIIAQVKADAAGSAISDIPVTSVRAGDVDQGEIMELLSPSLFAEDRVVVLTNMAEAGKEPAQLILEAAVDPAPGIVLIIVHSGGGRTKALIPKFKKIAEVHEVKQISLRERPQWVRQEFYRHGVRATPEVVRAVLQSVGSDTRELATAISQLVADTGGQVTEEKVREYYIGVAEVSGFDIAELAVSGRTAQAVANTRRALQLGISPVALTAALASKMGGIARLYSLRGRVDSYSLAGELKMPPFAVDKLLKIARQWNPQAISHAVVLIAELDAAVKGQGGDPNYAIETAVRRIGELASQ